MSALEIFAREFTGMRGGDFELTMRFEANPGEHIYGMGQYQDGMIDKKGCVLELAHRNSQASVRFTSRARDTAFSGIIPPSAA